MFLDMMRSRVSGQNKRVLFADGENKLVIHAAAQLCAERLVRPVLLGSAEVINKLASANNIDIAGVEIHDQFSDPNFESYVQNYIDLNADKKPTHDEALKIMRQPGFFAAMLLREGKVDGLVSGLTSDSKPFKPAFEIIQLKLGYERASSVFILEWPERLLFFADCAVNIRPDASELAEIAFATVETVKWLNVEPRVAFLSFSSHGSADDPEVEKIAEATRLAKLKMPGVVIDGELQFDAALLPEIAKVKEVDTPFTESGANIFIFPDLNSGNIAYKISERLGEARATGPVLQGLNKPVNDVSRGCTVEGLVNAAVITAALAEVSEFDHHQ